MTTTRNARAAGSSKQSPPEAVTTPQPPGEGYFVSAEVPSIEDYRMLRSGAGLNDKSRQAAEIGLTHSWHSVLVRHEGAAVGMGRIVGDGACHLFIVDMCVLPQHQGRGLGRVILQALCDEMDQRAPATAFISLIADGEARHLYRKFGFIDTAPDSIGMYRPSLT